MADIPISLNLFLSFWVNKVIGPQLEVYTLKRFIDDAVNELVLGAMGPDCYGEGATNVAGGNPKVSFTIVSAPRNADGSDRIARKKRISADMSDVTPTPTGDFLGNAAYVTPDRHVEYLFIYSYAWTLQDLDGNRVADKEKGIHHIGIGRDAGPIKSITFDKEDNEWRNTAAALEAQGIGNLAAVYTANVDMVGNNLFNIGNYVYVTPSGLGMDMGMASQLGLGGYYTITKMNGKIDSSGWSVDMEAFPIFSTAGEVLGKDSPSSDKGGDTPADPANPTPDPSTLGNDPEIGGGTIIY